MTERARSSGPRRIGRLPLGVMLAVVDAFAAATAVADSPEAKAGPPACKSPDAPMVFEQHYIDTKRAGGEPIVETHPDGTVLWGSHAGTTHFYAPAATEGDSTPFLRNYEGQTYQ